MINENNTRQLVLIPENYTDAFDKNTDCTMQFIVYSNDIETLTSKVLRQFLVKFDMLFLKDVLDTILRELINNASKANVKRLYFKNKQLDILKKEDYIKGMDTFKEEVFIQSSNIFNELMDSNYRVKVNFKTSDNKPSIKVSNNIPIIEEEAYKIEARIKKAYRYEDITEAFSDVLDDSEGAGLGLIMSLMLFKNTGFDKENFKLSTDNNETSFIIDLSARSAKQDVGMKIADEILKEIDVLPSFSDNIMRISTMCDKHDIKIQELSDVIKQDPALTSSILKRANSAAYITSQRISNIEEAIINIGLQGIKVLSLAAGMERVIESKYKEFKDIWEESYKKAFYAHKIASYLKRPKLTEKAYLAALLSKIGKIVLLSINKEVIENIIQIAGIKKIRNPDILEEMTLGVSHSTLGGIITRKWQFDDPLCSAIEFHMRPHLAPEAHKELIYITYLAHILTEIEINENKNIVIDDEVINYFKLTNTSSGNMVNSLFTRVRNDYAKQVKLNTMK